MSHQPVPNVKPLLDAARVWGADLAAVADTSRLQGIETDPADLLQGYPRAISMAVRLADGIMDPIVDRPTPLYSRHYQNVNALLDDIATRVSCLIQSWGGRALPVPASHILSEARFTAAVSHKAVALCAGLGWQGKSLLLVTPKFGPRVRLVTVLTDLDLPAAAPVKNKCGKCTNCVEACPAGAIKNASTELHFATRSEAVDLEACVEQLRRNEKEAHIPPYLCGVCVAACPWGKRKKSAKSPA
ncbi:MAG: 4Fe-4S double cluster binding domain-containing protein [Desulfonatronovibrionaceae bacterium]